MSNTHPTPRAALFASTFFTVLPLHYESICTRWTKIASLHHSAKSDIIPTERAGALTTLISELEMLEHDISEYRALVNGIDITDMAGIYVCAGRGGNIALQMAKEDLEDVRHSLGEVEEKVGEIRAEIAYGFEGDEGEK